MAITANTGRSYVISAEVTYDTTSFATAITLTPGESQNAIVLPANSTITGGFTVIDTAWDDTGPTATFLQEWGITGDIAIYMANQALDVVNVTDNFLVLGTLVSADTDIVVTIEANTGSLNYDTGSSRALMEYTTAGFAVTQKG